VEIKPFISAHTLNFNTPCSDSDLVLITVNQKVKEMVFTKCTEPLISTDTTHKEAEDANVGRNIIWIFFLIRPLIKNNSITIFSNHKSTIRFDSNYFVFL